MCLRSGAPGENTVPVHHPNGIIDYAGSTPIPPELLKWRGHKGNQIKNEYSQWVWRQYASSNWHDIQRIDNTLGSGASLYSREQRRTRTNRTRSTCTSLQLDVIEPACITLWSNPDEVVATPFLGVGSEVYQAVKMGRRGIGIELKPAYYRPGCKESPVRSSRRPLARTRRMRKRTCSRCCPVSQLQVKSMKHRIIETVELEPSDGSTRDAIVLIGVREVGGLAGARSARRCSRDGCGGKCPMTLAKADRVSRFIAKRIPRTAG